MTRLPFGAGVDWDLAREQFIDRAARDALVEESAEITRDDGVVSVARLRAAAHDPDPGALAALFDGPVVPMAARRLYRDFLARSSLAFSPAARAASSDDDFRRQIGPFEFDFVIEDDAAFFVISPIGEDVPRRLMLIASRGGVLSLDLPEPIAGVIQLGLARDDPRFQQVHALLQDKGTAINLQ